MHDDLGPKRNRPRLWGRGPTLIPPKRWRSVIQCPTGYHLSKFAHHSVTLEFDLPIYRTNAAQNRQSDKESDRQK